MDIMNTFEYESLNLGAPSIRLLRLCRGEGPEIYCDIFHARFDDDDSMIPYEAVSYAWGSLSITRHVKVDGTSLEITKNLYDALLCLRPKDEDRILWVDAICIDQKNVHERSHQVQQMDRIYKTADSVVFWLGEATYATDVVMKSVQMLHRTVSRMAHRNWEAEDPRWKQLWDNVQVELRYDFPDLAETQRAGMEELLKRPWFKRVWILQEVTNARRATAQCGAKSAPAGLFALTPKLMAFKKSFECQVVLDIMPGPLRAGSWWAHSSKLYDLLEKCHYAEASDSRDLIYALLGMASDQSLYAALKADYTKTPTELIQDVCQSIFYGLIPISTVERIQTIRDLMQKLYLLNSTAINTLLDHFDMGKFETAVSLFRRGDIRRRHVIQMFKELGTRAAWQYGPSVSKVTSEMDTVMDMKDFDRGNFLAEAAKFGEFDVVRFLIECGCVANLRSFLGDIPLSLAVRSSPKAIALLLHRNQDGGIHEALLVAAECGSEELVNMLLNAGSDINYVGSDDHGRPALLRASIAGSEAVTRTLIDQGSPINYVDDFGMSPISYSAWYGHEGVVRLLINNGVDVNSTWRTNGMFWTGAGISTSQKRLLTMLSAKHRKSRLTSIETVLTQTPLAIAAMLGHTSVAQLLLDSGAFIEAKDELGMTPLHHALDGEHFEIIDLLLERGANDALLRAWTDFEKLAQDWTASGSERSLWFAPHY